MTSDSNASSQFYVKNPGIQKIKLRLEFSCGQFPNLKMDFSFNTTRLKGNITYDHKLITVLQEAR